MLKPILLLSALCWSACSCAAIQILATRVILYEAEKEQSFTIRNTGDAPSLVQIWLSKKDNSSMNITDDIPLAIMPPIARINAGSSKVFRFFPTEKASAALPADRESMFWINALDVPAVDDENVAENKLNIAFRTRIKAFYRPSGIKGTLIEAGENLQWSMSKEANNLVYTVNNKSPYHISVVDFSLKKGEETISSLPGDVIAPWEIKKYKFKNVSDSSASLNYQYISDLGAYIPKRIVL